MNIEDQISKSKMKDVIAVSGRFGLFDIRSLRFAFGRSVLLSLLLVVLGAGQVRAETRVYARVESDTTIYPGQAFTYSIVVEGGAEPTNVDISPIAKFNPRRGASGTSMHSINGQTSITYSQNFAITPEEPGKMVLPGLSVVVDGKTYVTNAVEVTVATPGTTDRLDVEMSLSETTCYVGQPAVMTVKWTITAQVKDPSFDVPAFKSDDFYLEDLNSSGQTKAHEQGMIHGVPITAFQEQRVIRGMEAVVISFSKVLIPKRAGRIALDPVTVSADMVTGRILTNDIFNRYRPKYERFSVQSASAELNVLPLPETDKPAGFYGLVGHYTISASATPTKVSVGDPITLTIRIGGNPYLKPVQWPDLEGVPALAGNFKIPTEKASPIVENGQKVFTQTIRANNDDVTEVPGIPLAFFDPQAGRYTVARTKPIRLEVAPTKVLTNADVEGTAPGVVGRRVEAIREGFSANYYSPEVLVNQKFSLLSAALSPSHAVLWSVPFLGLAASVLLKLSSRTSPEAAARKRRRQACSTALGQLKAADAAEADQRYDLIVSAMKGYLGDRFARTAGSLTADDCYDVVAVATGDAPMAERFKAKISAFEAARYTSINASVDSEQIAEAIELIRSVEEKSKR